MQAAELLKDSRSSFLVAMTAAFTARAQTVSVRSPASAVTAAELRVHMAP